MGERPGRRQVEYTVRSDLVAAMRASAAKKGVSSSRAVEAALRDYLAVQGPPVALVPAARERLRLRLPLELIAAVTARAGELVVGDRVLVEGALARSFSPARGPGWDPNRPLGDPVR